MDAAKSTVRGKARQLFAARCETPKLDTQLFSAALSRQAARRKVSAAV
jgi:hypothetical protein